MGSAADNQQFNDPGFSHQLIWIECGLIFYCLARADREAVKNRFPELSLRPPRSPVTTLRYLENVCSPSG